jgi:hypothetical protein
MVTIRHALIRCPHCGYPLNSATSTPSSDWDVPEPGDLSLCISCDEWLVFDTGTTLRKPTEDELVEIGLDAECRHMRAIWLKFKEQQL